MTPQFSFICEESPGQRSSKHKGPGVVEGLANSSNKENREARRNQYKAVRVAEEDLRRPRKAAR